MRIYRWLLILCASLGLAACQDPDDGPRHLTPEEIEELIRRERFQQAIHIMAWLLVRRTQCGG